jgi:peptidoglycan hydrolase CwlO-like protein
MEIVSAIASGAISNVAIFALLLLQMSQMYFDSKKESKVSEIRDLQSQITNLTALHTENKKEIEELRTENKGLQSQIIELRQENGELKGLLSGLSKDQKVKEKLLKLSTKTV